MEVRLVQPREARTCALTGTLAAQGEAAQDEGGLSRRREEPRLDVLGWLRESCWRPILLSLQQRGQGQTAVCSALTHVPREALGCRVRKAAEPPAPWSVPRSGLR